MDSQSEIAAYPALADIFDSLSLDNVPSDSVWHKLPNSSRQDVLDTRLMLMKIGQTQYREKGHTQEESKAMEESLANSLAAVNINSELNSALESSASGEPFTSKSEPQYDTRALTGNVLKPENHPFPGDFVSKSSSERRGSQT